MKLNFKLVLGLLLIWSCSENVQRKKLKIQNWSDRAIEIKGKDSLEHGKSYLSIYSQIYSLTQEKTHNLTAMASLRNLSGSDTIYLLKAEYYDTHGKLVRNYFDRPIFLSPMETVEIVIDEIDVEGGTGSNFLFEWKTPKNCPEPLFEGVMSSTMAQQGLSFTTQGKRIE
ncbi:DUF3124 domain-containing protein [Flagellimonas sp. S174]|uniref:DUF3124 domain-containing protein n=1 Tax=Flagellimonas sp. S174 TaxID=3410790 RepID=UPI003BF5840A